MTTGARVLVVDDEVEIVRAVRANLAARGYQVTTADSGLAALAQQAQQRADVILLDLGLPDMDGLEVIRRLRVSDAAPIIVLSVRGSDRDKVAALDEGADDYLTKPFSVDELLARIRVALRHAANIASAAPIFRTGQLEVDLPRRRVTLGGREVHLSPTEYELLKVLIAHRDRVLTHRMLLQQVWGPGYGEEAHYLHVYMAGLRRKLEEDPRNPVHLITEPGVGYRFSVPADG